MPYDSGEEVSDEECINLTKTLGKRVGEELKIPIYLYEKSAQIKIEPNFQLLGVANTKD